MKLLDRTAQRARAIGKVGALGNNLGDGGISQLDICTVGNEPLAQVVHQELGDLGVRLSPASFWKTTTSSTRFKVSGRNRRLSSPIARLLISVEERPAPPVLPKPTLDSCAIRARPRSTS